MQIYHFHPATRELLGSSKADQNPMSPGAFLVPAWATNAEPPAAGDGQAAVFDIESETWSLVPDHRGRRYWLQDGTEGKVEALGDIPPEGALDAAPPAPPPTAAEIRRALSRAVSDYLDGVARTWDYASILSAVSYLGDPDPIFAAEANALFNWRSTVFVAVRQVEADVVAGRRAPPTPDELLAALPAPPARPAQAA